MEITFGTSAPQCFWSWVHRRLMGTVGGTILHKESSVLTTMPLSLYKPKTRNKCQIQYLVENIRNILKSQLNRHFSVRLVRLIADANVSICSMTVTFRLRSPSETWIPVPTRCSQREQKSKRNAEELRFPCRKYQIFKHEKQIFLLKNKLLFFEIFFLRFLKSRQLTGNKIPSVRKINLFGDKIPIRTQNDRRFCPSPKKNLPNFLRFWCYFRQTLREIAD